MLPAFRLLSVILPPLLVPLSASEIVTVCARLKSLVGVYSKKDWDGSEENVFLPFVFFRFAVAFSDSLKKEAEVFLV